MKIEEIEKIADALETYGAEGIYLTPPMTGDGADAIAFGKQVKKLLAVAKAAKDCDLKAQYRNLDKHFYEVDAIAFLTLNKALEDLERE